MPKAVTEEPRQRTEQVTACFSDILSDPLMTDEKRLLHEIQVHQIELELQNQELFELRCEAELLYRAIRFRPDSLFLLGF